MTKEIKNDLVALAKELYESSKESIEEVLEMDIEDLDYGTLEYESSQIIQLGKMIDLVNEADKNNELDSVDDKLDLRFIKEVFESKKELKSFLRNMLYEPYDEKGIAIIDYIVELIFR